MINYLTVLIALCVGIAVGFMMAIFGVAVGVGSERIKSDTEDSRMEGETK